MARVAFVLTLLQLAASAATLVQQLFIARVVGANEQTDGYQIALALVLFLAQSVIATALVNAFVPSLSTMARENVDRSRAYAFWVQINVVLGASVITVLLWIATPMVMALTAAGLSPDAHFWAVESFRLMLLSMPLAALSGVYTSSLYAAGDLRFVAAAQVAQNGVAAAVSLIGYFLIGFLALPLSLVLGYAIGSVAMFGRLHRRSLLPSQTSSFPRASSASILRATAAPLVVPVLLAVPGFVERFFMSYFPVGQIAILAYAGRIFSVAIAFGVSIGIVTLSKWGNGESGDVDGADGARTSHMAASAVLFVLMPATLVLLVMPDVIVRGLFAGSAMDAGQLALMSAVLSIYSLSLVPMALVGVLMRGHFASGHARGALNTTLVWITMWILLDLALIPRFGIYGLAIASVLAVWFALLSALVSSWHEPWVSTWQRVLLSRETLAVVISSLVSVGLSAAAFRLIGPPLALMAVPVSVAGYVGMSAIGGSSLARAVFAQLRLSGPSR